MYGFNLVAVYESMATAERVRQRLISHGIPSADIRLNATADAQPAPTPAEPAHEPGFFDWLLHGTETTPERENYAGHFRQNRAAIAVRVPEKDHDEVIDILEEFAPIDIDETESEINREAQPTTKRVPDSALGALGSGAPGARSEVLDQRPIGARHENETAAAMPGTGSAGQAGPRTRTEEDRVIPVVKEQLTVGKEANERRYRVKTYLVERPVEEQVTLRDERVEIERRPASGDRDATLPQEGTIDITERHEQAVAEKHGRVAEEVVVRKEVTERPETVRGTVQETKVEVEKPDGERSTGAIPPNPNNPIRR